MAKTDYGVQSLDTYNYTRKQGQDKSSSTSSTTRTRRSVSRGTSNRKGRYRKNSVSKISNLKK